MDDVTVVVGTYGDIEIWEPLARRAIESAQQQTVAPHRVIWSHRHTLQEARNSAASNAETEWLIFLDADDELAPDYIEKSLAGSGDIRRPSTLGIYEDGSEDAQPVLIQETDLRTSNCIVIGAMNRKSFFDEVGGFRNFPILEDWDLWRRMVASGAVVRDAPEAVYRVHVRPGSRNSDPQTHGNVYQQIVKDGTL